MNTNKNIIFNPRYQCDLNEGQIDFAEVLARMAQDTLFNRIKLEAKKEAPQEWADFVKAIKDGEKHLFLKLKGAEKFASKCGSYYLVFELYNGVFKIHVAQPDIENQIVRINQGEELAAVVKLNYFSTNNYVGLATKECYTTKDVNRYILQTTITPDQSSTIPLNVFLIKTPAYLQAKSQNGIYQHNYGVLPAKQFLNKNIVDFEFNEYQLSDLAPVRSAIKEMNNYLFGFVFDEFKLDTTKLIGRLSYQDQATAQVPNAQTLSNLLSNGKLYDQPFYKAQNGSFSAREYVMNKLIVNTTGSDNKIEKMQTTFNMSQHIGGLNDLTNYIFSCAGYSWDKAEGDANYQNTASIVNVNKNVFHTTKMKKIQREADFYEFMERMAHVYFKFNKNLNDYEASIEAANVYKYVDFEIISDLIKDFINSDERVIALRNSNIMSLKKAVEKINPDMSEEDINQEVADIKEQQEQDAQALLSTERDEGDINTPEVEQNPANDKVEASNNDTTKQ